MAYCTQSDIEKFIPIQELAELTTDSGDTPDNEKIVEAILQADAEIDAYCGKQYNVPFSTTPVRVKNLSKDMAIYHLYSIRSVAPEVRRQKYEDAVSFLKDVAKGLAVIGDTDSPPDSSGGDALPDIESSDRVFSRTSMWDL